MTDPVQLSGAPHAPPAGRRTLVRVALFGSVGLFAILAFTGGKAAVSCTNVNDFCQQGEAPRACTDKRQWTRSLSCMWKATKNAVKQPFGLGSEQGRRAKIDVTVSSNDELHSALARAGNGSTVKLMAGFYPAASINGVQIDGNVTITSADTAHRAVIHSLTVRGSSGLTFSHIDLPATAPDTRYGMLVLNSHDIKLDQLVFTSPAVPVDIKIVSALELRNVKNVVVSRSQFRNFRHGIGILNVENAQIIANEFRDMRTDGIRGGGVNNILIARNVCTDFYPVVPDHPDCIQLWSTAQPEPGRNIRIIDNIAWRRHGIRTQGIFIRDTLNKMPFENVEISGNLMIGTMFHGIAISGVRGGSITNNEVIAYPDQKAWILVANGSDVIERDNRSQAFTFKNAPGVVQVNNKVTNPTDKHIARRIAAWLAARPDMQKNAGPLLRELSTGEGGM